LRTEGSYDIGKLTANRNCEKRLFNKFWGGNPIASAVGAVKIEPLRDGCQVMWECDAKFGGMIAKVGNRVMGVIAKFLAENFFKGLQKQLHARV
jgi:uncharacterized protein